MELQQVFSVVQVPTIRVGALTMDNTYFSRLEAEERCAELNEGDGWARWVVDARLG